MPQLGETVTEGTVAQWLKKPGDSIEKYESFVEVSTDKVNAEVPSPVSGVLREIIAKEGETVPTGAPIAIIDEVGAEPAEMPGATPAPSAAPVTAGTNGAARGANGVSNDAELLRGVSPAVRRLAREHQVDLATVRGTGANGRITANDVLATAATTGAAAAPAAAPQPHAAPEPAANGSRPKTAERSTYAAPQPGTLVPLSQARKIIAERMVESLATAPHAWTMVEVDVTKAWALRAKEKERFARERGVALTLLPFFIHAVVQALRKHPLLNARFTAEGIEVLRQINVGIAVGLDTTLVVPVIRDADTLSIAGLALAAGKLIEKARNGKLGADDLAGGTFTVNNTGANGSVLSKPIINGGQAGIITMEAVIKRPVVIDDAIAIRSIMNVCLSLDHRVIDGTIANAFLAEVKKRLEAFGPGSEL
jgi:2-oxoisovalerate dehydrogenase E2 component (dihydrolipoyl transacylase)